MTTILVVEDESSIRDLIERRLAIEGYQIIHATNGALAIALARSEQPDLIVMDIGLPIMNGWQATQRLKSQPETRAIPILALTAYAMSEDRQRSLDAGCDAYETKPIDFASLLQKIRGLLDRT
jgi:two-component system, cell cycle response regulator DivK